MQYSRKKLLLLLYYVGNNERRNDDDKAAASACAWSTEETCGVFARSLCERSKGSFCEKG